MTQPSLLPNPGSPEASAMMDSVLAEYNYPSNTKNAARAGYEAARRIIAVAMRDAIEQEPWGWAIVDKNGNEHETRPRKREFFGDVAHEQPSWEPSILESCVKDWPGLAPFSLVTLYTSPQPAPQVPSRVSWQPIETAPNDGTAVLLYTVQGIIEGYFSYGGWEQCVCEATYDMASAIIEGKPTHWMPLPTAPITKEYAEIQRTKTAAVSAPLMLSQADDDWELDNYEIDGMSD